MLYAIDILSFTPRHIGRRYWLRFHITLRGQLARALREIQPQVFTCCMLRHWPQPQPGLVTPLAYEGAIGAETRQPPRCRHISRRPGILYAGDAFITVFIALEEGVTLLRHWPQLMAIEKAGRYAADITCCRHYDITCRQLLRAGARLYWRHCRRLQLITAITAAGCQSAAGYEL